MLIRVRASPENNSWEICLKKSFIFLATRKARYYAEISILRYLRQRQVYREKKFFPWKVSLSFSNSHIFAVRRRTQRYKSNRVSQSHHLSNKWARNGRCTLTPTRVAIRKHNIYRTERRERGRKSGGQSSKRILTSKRGRVEVKCGQTSEKQFFGSFRLRERNVNELLTSTDQSNGQPLRHTHILLARMRMKAVSSVR